LQYIKLIFLYLCLFTTNVFSDTLDRFIASLDEQATSAEWVVKNAQTKLTQQQAQSIVSHTYAHSLSNDINPKLLLALIKTESGFIKNAKSNHKAIGLTQIIQKWHKKKLKNRSPLNPVVAIEVGTLILKECFVSNKNNEVKALSCYNGSKNKIYFNKVKKQEHILSTYIKNQTILTLAQNN